MFAIFTSQSGVIAAQIAFSMPQPEGKNDARIYAIEENSFNDLTFDRFEENLPEGVYNGDEGF